MTMGVNGVYFPSGSKWKTEAPKWTLEFWHNIRIQLSSWCEKNKIPLINIIIEKESSAELSEDQRDSDSLPVYPLLDAILKLYIEEDLLDASQAQ